MADSKKLFKIIQKWEGGWSNHQADKGGKTNMGITLSTWKSCGYDKDGDGHIDADDLKLITAEDVYKLFVRCYWNRYKADYIHNQSISNILVDWLWGSGSIAIKSVQRLLSIQVDGIVGSQTISSINLANQRELFNRIKEERLIFIDKICKSNPSQEVFKKGWCNRINSFTFSS